MGGLAFSYLSQLVYCHLIISKAAKRYAFEASSNGSKTIKAALRATPVTLVCGITHIAKPTNLPPPCHGQRDSLGYNTCLPPDSPRLQKQIQLSMGVKSGNGKIMLIAITPSPICALQHQKECISPQLEVRLYVARHPLTAALVVAQGRCSKKDCTKSKNARLNSGISIAPGGETFGCSNLHAALQLAQTPVHS